MTKVISLTNQKGGIGKTSLTHAFVRGLAMKGKKVLGIDFDPSGNLSENSQADRKETPGSIELLLNAADIGEMIQYIEYGDYYLIASPEKRKLNDRQFRKMLAQNDEPLFSLKRRMDDIIKMNIFDYIVVDTGPDINELTMNVLIASDEIIVPTTTNKNSLDGIPDLLDAIMAAQEAGNTGLRIRGILVNRFKPRFTSDRATESTIEQMARELEAPVFKTYIRNAQEVENATDHRMDVLTYSPNHEVSKDIMRFIDEFLKGEEDG
ncbi:ParA family protein [Eubacteriales bacterium OttesenSCG-928-A19]|nr:ParA family protein [Eubacteriales bacterium OttesenSCG-928-A19]